MARAAPSPQLDRLQIPQRLSRGLRRPSRHILKPRPDHLITLFDPALVRHRPRMSVRRASPDVLRRQTRRPTHSRANLVRPLIGENLNVQVQVNRRSPLVRQRQRRHPKIHINPLCLLVFLRPPSAVGDIGRRASAASARAGQQELVFCAHREIFGSHPSSRPGPTQTLPVRSIAAPPLLHAFKMNPSPGLQPESG